MPKERLEYVCQQCGRVSARPMGRCPQCGAWNSMQERLVAPPARESAVHAARGLGSASQLVLLHQVEDQADERLPLASDEFARVLGGGVVPGSIVLLAGDPGIGKSTLMLQIALEMAWRSTVLYVSGEESPRQIKMRAARLVTAPGSAEPASIPQGLYLLSETNLEAILHHVEDLRPAVLIVDSVQTAYLPELDSLAGSVTQVRECASRLRELAKASGVSVFLIGHVTKEGIIAGPRILEHIVDTVLYLEGDRFQAYRLLRSVKNRFGTTAEVGVFEMSVRGMQEVRNPSEVFLAERMVSAPGSAIAVTMEGTRAMLVEVQGLTSPTAFGNPRRTANGVDFNRLLLITAVLTRRVGLKLSEQDVFVNVVGGLSIDEPAADVAVAAALASSYYNRPLQADLVLIGEVGLSGELRTVSQMEPRLREAARLGFRRAILPRWTRRDAPPLGEIEILEARTLRQAIDKALLAEQT